MRDKIDYDKAARIYDAFVTSFHANGLPDYFQHLRDSAQSRLIHNLNVANAGGSYEEMLWNGYGKPPERRPQALYTALRVVGAVFALLASLLVFASTQRPCPTQTPAPACETELACAVHKYEAIDTCYRTISTVCENTAEDVDLLYEESKQMEDEVRECEATMDECCGDAWGAGVMDCSDELSWFLRGDDSKIDSDCSDGGRRPGMYEP